MRQSSVSLAAMPLVGLGGLAWAHPGDIDRNGGHTDTKTSIYHVHNCMVAGNKRSKIYHVPGGQFYGQMATTSQNKVSFGSEAEAERAGARKAKR